MTAGKLHETAMVWRCKMMFADEWKPIQQRFEELQMVQSHPDDMALFIKTDPDQPVDEVYAIGEASRAIEDFSAGGWEDSGAPCGPGVAVLVGGEDAFERFGITKE